MTIIGRLNNNGNLLITGVIDETQSITSSMRFNSNGDWIIDGEFDESSSISVTMRINNSTSTVALSGELLEDQTL